MCLEEKKKKKILPPLVLAYFHLQFYTSCHYVYSDTGVNYV